MSAQPAAKTVASFVVVPRLAWAGLGVVEAGPALPPPSGGYRVELLPVISPGGWLLGEEFRNHARLAGGNAGLPVGEFLLVHQDQIPAEYRGKALILSEAELEDADGHRYLPCLFCSFGFWQAATRGLSSVISDYYLAVRVVPCD